LNTNYFSILYCDARHIFLFFPNFYLSLFFYLFIFNFQKNFLEISIKFSAFLMVNFQNNRE